MIFCFSLTSNKSIFFGLQASLRNLKSQQIKLLVLSADLKPRYVANQIILQALACNDDIRIVCVPNLAQFTKTLLNFACYAFVITNDKWSELTELEQWTTELIRINFPLPSIIKSHFGVRNEKQPIHHQMDVDELQFKQRKEHNSNEKNIDVNHLHLIRDCCNTNQRVFVPKNGINMKPIALEIESLNNMKTDFISLDTYDNSTAEPLTFSSSKNSDRFFKKKGKRPLTLYRELTIHKIQNNPNKVKKLKSKNNKNKKK